MNVSEQAIIELAREIESKSAWIIGEKAFRWQQTYARGRPLCDFAALIRIDVEHVAQCLNVFKRFADMQHKFPDLRWTHFKAALEWDDANECLAWANEMRATVAEMRSWRRARRGDEEPAEVFRSETGKKQGELF